jgi:hypothetical protein
MKINVKKEEKFKPIKIEICIESEQELCNLYHNFNVPHKIIKKEESKFIKLGFTKFEMSFFNVLNELITENNLKK